MKNIELKEMLNIPIATLSDWKKKDGDNWRRLVYELLINMDKEELKKKVEAIKLLKGLK